MFYLITVHHTILFDYRLHGHSFCTIVLFSAILLASAATAFSLCLSAFSAAAVSLIFSDVLSYFICLRWYAEIDQKMEDIDADIDLDGKSMFIVSFLQPEYSFSLDLSIGVFFHQMTANYEVDPHD
jgi:hypothetical protein